MRWILWISLLTESYSFGWNLLARCHPDAFRAPRTTLLSSTATNNAEGDCTQIIRILYETDSILAIEKPEGVSHHDGEQEQGILTLVRQCQNDGSIEYSGRIFGVHRLDRVTSGILLLAKNQDTASKLTAAFRDGHVVKYYVGVSSKKPRKKQGWVRGNMERGRRKSWYLTRGGEKGSTYAITRFFTTSIAHLSQSGQDVVPRTCLLFRPYTGRTHQLRVTAKSVGLPLLGDPIYRDGVDLSKSLSSRTCLHATALHVALVGEDPVTIWSPPPFEHLWEDDTAAASFHSIILELLEKHCDCDEIKRLVMQGDS